MLWPGTIIIVTMVWGAWCCLRVGAANTNNGNRTTTTPATTTAVVRPLPAAPDKQYHPNRPIFNIAHMVNSVPEIDQYLSRGANAIETDIYFAPNATPIATFHGYPCDCFRYCGERERLDVFLDRVRSLTTPAHPLFDKRLLLIFLDLKLGRISHGARALAGQQLAETLLKYLYNGTTRSTGIEPRPPHSSGSRIRTLISIGHVFDYDFVLGFQNEMESRDRHWLTNQFIGWDVGMNDPLFAIESMWKRLDMVYNIWQGDGRPNCLSPFYNLGRLAQIVRRRDNPSFFAIKNYIRKVYQWTVDLTVNIRTALRSDVDAIITNHPERVYHVIKENEFSPRFRLAKYTDSPWERVWTRPARPLTSSVISRPGLTLKLVNGAGDMLESFSKFITDSIKYQTPLRHFYMSVIRKRNYHRHRRLSTATSTSKYRSEDDIQQFLNNNNNVTKNMSEITAKNPTTTTTTTTETLAQRLISLMIDLLLMQLNQNFFTNHTNNNIEHANDNRI